VPEMKAILRAKYQERLEERTRIARNLHDTLIQTIHGSKLLADQAQEHPEDPTIMSHALKQLSVWLEGAINEGRIALDSLRSIPPEDIAIALFKVSEMCIPTSMRCNIVIEGAESELEASVQEEAYRIAAEAVRNACVHSDGSMLTIQINYGRGLVIAVSDDGKRGDALRFHEDKPGHYGVRGMYERARSIGASLSIQSIPGRGTTVTLRVPGRLAYKDSSVVRAARKMKDRFRDSARQLRGSAKRWCGRITTIGLANAWRFLNESAARLKLRWDL
jgi:signal transduction histidine kinase